MPKKAQNPGIGRGRHERPKTEKVCITCGNTYLAYRSDSRFCPACKNLRKNSTDNTFESRHQRQCLDCGTPITRKSTRCQKCASKIRNLPGELNTNWRGGRIRKQGYIYVHNPHPERRKHKYVAEHIALWEEANGPIPDGHHIHHINGIRDDNRLENLQMLTIGQHYRVHNSKDFKEYIQSLESKIRELEGKISLGGQPP